MRELAKGSEGEDVRALQDRLNYHLRRVEALTLDGKFGPLTQGRVKTFQSGLGLRDDGIVGSRTRAQLFETHTYPAQVIVIPPLTRPTFGNRAAVGIQPPRLIPPLTFPQSPQIVLQAPITILPTITLRNVGMASFQSINRPSLLNVDFTVVPVKDMRDPVVRATQNLMQFANEVNIDSKFKAFAIGKIPSPISKIEEPNNSFSFNPLKPSYNPLDGGKIGNKGSAAFTFRVIGKPGDVTPQVAIEGRAEGEVQLEYNGKASSNYFKATSEWSFALGFVGVF